LAASYPSAIKSFTTRIAGDTIQPAHINDLQDEVAAIETDIFTNGLTLTSGQIDFPATQVPSAGANTLDDYEEGTFTPTITSAGGGAGTYGTQVAGYVKIGRKVSVSGRVVLATKGTLAAGAVSISGLPFAALNTANLYFAATSPSWVQLATTAVNVTGFISPGGSAIELTLIPSATASPSAMVIADLNATGGFVFAAEYQAAN
jgi:hypothetical protein